MNWLNWLFARMSEPSTHAGIAGIAQAAKIFAPQYAPILDVVTGAFSGAAVVISEKGKTDEK